MRVVEKLVSQNTAEDDNSYYVYLAIENKTEGELRFDVSYESLKINSKPLNYWCNGLPLKPGEVGLLEISIPEGGMMEHQIKSVDDIKEVDLILIYENSYDPAIEVPIQLDL